MLNRAPGKKFSERFRWGFFCSDWTSFLWNVEGDPAFPRVFLASAPVIDKGLL